MEIIFNTEAKRRFASIATLLLHLEQTNAKKQSKQPKLTIFSKNLKFQYFSPFLKYADWYKLNDVDKLDDENGTMKTRRTVAKIVH